MTSVDERIRKIEAAEEGPGVAAYFDYDGTLISGFSAESFYKHRFFQGDLGPVEIGETVLTAARGIREPEEISAFMDLSLASLRGKSVEEIDALGETLFRDDISSRVHMETWRIVEAHRARGHRIVIASSATPFQVQPMAREIHADAILCTRLEVQDGLLTGKTEGPAVWGPEKAAAAVEYARDNDLDLAKCFAYANGDEDIPFLSTVGNPVAVEPARHLKKKAEREGWPILRCAPRGGTPSLGSVARTVGFYAAMASAAGTGLGIGLLNASRRAAVDVTFSVGCEVGLALAGVEVKVLRGEEHLWSSRPCVFVFNHQSKLDPIVVGRLLRSGFTGVAKKEAEKVPGFGPFFKFAGVAFVERGNTTQAREALAPAVEKVRTERISLAIAPEGTRSPTPRLGPFKKGAFHIAMQAGVPMVPIVLRNVGEVMWRGAQVIQPGTVEVVVLPPVPTDTWSAETIDQHVEEVRNQFLHTLDPWVGA